jgi:threonine synthase
MLYLSTRGHADRKRFCDILLEGLAPDGGLYLPERYPQIDAARLGELRSIYREQGYAALAFEILSLYIDDIPAEDLRALCAKTYTQQVFGTAEITPLRRLEDGLWLEALSNGPTLAFKDMAMQLLGNCSSTNWAAAAKSSTSWAPPAATPAAQPSTPCAASRACACS